MRTGATRTTMYRPAMHRATSRAKLARHNSVEHRLEVVQENRIRRTLEHKRKPPIRIDPRLRCHPRRTNHHIREQKPNRDKHASQHDAKAAVDAHQRPQREPVRRLDRAREPPRGEDPPGVAHEGFPGAQALVGARAQPVEVGEVGPGFGEPEGLDEEECPDEEAGGPAGEEGSDFEPRDDVV